MEENNELDQALEEAFTRAFIAYMPNLGGTEQEVVIAKNFAKYWFIQGRESVAIALSERILRFGRSLRP